MEDILLIKHANEASKSANLMSKYFECENIDKLIDCVECKITKKNEKKTLKIMNSSIISSL
jgi:hypothetical protein